MIKISRLKNNPNNPRTIKKDALEKLKKSISEFPEMMEKRPMVCVTDAADKKIFPLGGNMRLKAIRELGFKEIPKSWVMMADDWTEEKRKEFVIKDNANLGDWNFEELVDGWDIGDLEEWGIDVPDWMNLDEKDLIDDEYENKKATLKITFVDEIQLQEAEQDIIELLDRKYKNAYYSVSCGGL